MINKLKQSIIQVLVFSFIPFIYFLIVNRRIIGFFDFLGFRKIVLSETFIVETIFIIIIMGILAIPPLLYLLKKGILNSDELEVNKFENKEAGIPLLGEILIFSLLVTSLSEELFFRGFLAKVLISGAGFVIGNSIHALLFGLIHGLPMKKYGIKIVIIMTSLPAVTAYILAWNNEIHNYGSIIPSIIIHAVVNIVSNIIMLKVLNKREDKLTVA